jgi:hypothetical protein
MGARVRVRETETERENEYDDVHVDVILVDAIYSVQRVLQAKMEKQIDIDIE